MNFLLLSCRLDFLVSHHRILSRSLGVLMAWLVLASPDPSRADAIVEITPGALCLTNPLYAACGPIELVLTNRGDAPCTFRVACDQPWLTVEPSTGVLPAGAALAAAAHPCTRGLAGGLHQARISVTGLEAAAETSCLVSLQIMAPDLPSMTVAWGYDYSGQTETPPALSNATAISTRFLHALAILNDGTVSAWGSDNLYGQLNVPAGLASVVATAPGMTHSLALRSDGTVAAWGSNAYGQTNVPPGLLPATALAAGMYHSLALLANGNVQAWGDNLFGQCTPPDTLTNAVAIAAGASHSLALRRDGTLCAWGDNSYGQSLVPDGATGIVAIAAGGYHNLALRADGTVIAWGRDNQGQATVPDDLHDIVALAGGWFHSLALHANGTVTAWGDNSSGEAIVPAMLTNAIAIAAGYGYSLAYAPATTLTITNGDAGIQPGCGTSWVIRNSHQTCAAQQYQEGDTRYTCTGWAGAGAVPSSGTGNQISYVATGAATVAWQWVPSAYHLTITTAGGGTVAPESGWYAAQSNLQLVATPAPGSLFQSWSGDTDGGEPTNVQLGLTVDRARTVQASFSGARMVLLPTRLSVTGTVFSTLTTPTLVVSNSGDQTLDFALESDRYWLVPSPGPHTIAPGNAVTIPLSLSSLGMQPGLHRGELHLTAPLATNAVANVPVSVLITPVAPVNRLIVWGTGSFYENQAPSGVLDTVAIAGGQYHAMALRQTGTVQVWGNNYYGQCTVPAGVTNAIAIAAGANHSLALGSNGRLISWGYNPYGLTTTPTAASNILAIAAGGDHSHALLAGGTVISWGPSLSGATDTPTDLTNAEAIAAGYFHALAIRGDGTVAVWGNNSYGQTNLPAGLNHAVAIASGWFHSLALRPDRTVVAWGNNSFGQCDVPPGLSNVVALSAGSYHSMALCSNGQLVVWGMNMGGQTNVPAVVEKAVALAGGQNVSLALLHANGPTIGLSPGSLSFSGRVYSAIAPKTITLTNSGDLAMNFHLHGECFWLSPDAPSGLLEAGASTALVVSVATRGLESRTYDALLTCSDPLAQGGTMAIPVSLTLTPPPVPSLIVAWGSDNAGERDVPGDATNSIALTAAGDHVLALRQDGSVAGWGDNAAGITDIPAAATNIVRIVAGSDHALALCRNGRLLGWGGNAFNQATIPDDLPPAITMAAGDKYSLALSSAGVLRAWGNNSSGQTTPPPGATNVVSVAAGETHVVALRADGHVLAWGGNQANQASVPPGATSMVAVAAGHAHSMALGADGKVSVWGDNSQGQASVPGWLSNVVAIAAGSNSCLALCQDGQVAAWGSNDSGQTNVPPGLTNGVAIASGAACSMALFPAVPLSVSSPGGPPSAGGQQWVISGSVLTLQNQPDTHGPTQYVCLGWTGTGSAPDQGNSNSVTFAITSDSTVMWHWGTNFMFTATATLPEGISGSSNGWYRAGSVVCVTATPPPYFQCTGWSGDLPPELASNAVVTIAVNRPRTLLATLEELTGAAHQTPYTWLARYHYTNAMDTAELETGANGMPVWVSYITDRDPSDPLSGFRILSINRDSGTRLDIPSSTGRWYALEWSTNLVEGTFTPVGKGTTWGNGSILPLTDSDTTGTRFYRVRVQVPH